MAPPPLPGMKKKEDKIFETMHNDKNITKKIEKAKDNKEKKTKNNQVINTDITIPTNDKKNEKISKKDSIHDPKEPQQIEETRELRLWEKVDEEKPKESLKSTPKQKDRKDPNFIQLKEVAIETNTPWQ